MSERAAMSQELERSAALIERMLGDPELRRRFRAEPGAVLRAHGLAQLAAEVGAGEKALRTLELRESRSSLAGAMVAAAAEGVDFAHVAGHVAPKLEHDAGRALDRLLRRLSHHASAARAAKAASPTIGPSARIPPLAQAGPAAGGSGAVAAGPAPASASVPAAAAPGAPGAAGAPGAPAASTGAAAGAGGGTAAGGVPAPASGVPAPPSGGAAPASGGAAVTAGPATGVDQHLHHNHHHHHHDGTLAGSPAGHPQDLLRYPRDGATPQRLAAWMGAHAARAGLPPELPVMAALTESNLHNLPYGDRDSVGFFQMRLGIWNAGAYRGYPDHPALQLQWFIDHALAVRAANPAVAASPGTWGDWVADVEQPAAQYRGRYALQLDTARELLRGVSFDEVVQAAAPVPVGKAALDVAMHYLGVPYRWGGSSPATGFDCSGLVQYAYAQVGIQLPRVAADQFHVGIPVSRQDLQPGDAVFFADPSGYVHHVGLYVGDGRFVNAPETGENVSVASLSDPYFASQYAGARRYIAGALGNPSRYARSLPVVRS